MNTSTIKEFETLSTQPTSGLVVDGSFLWGKKKLQYQVVDIETSELIYTSPVYIGGSSNVAEYLAIIHGLAYADKNGLKCDIYSDSYIAMGWVRKRMCRTREEMSEELKKVVDRSTLWLNLNLLSNKVLIWQSHLWGENPADFGRK